MGTGERAADHAVMRRVNRAVVLDVIRSTEASSRSAIAEATGLAKPTVGLIVDELMTAGLVAEVGRGEPGTVGGRPPVLLAFNARSSFLAGVHVGVRRTTVVVADALGTPLVERTMKTPAGRPPAALDRIAAAISDAAAGVGAGTGMIAAVGVCLPGLVATGGLLSRASALGWRDVPVAHLLGDRLGVPVVADNAARTALLAETRLGAARGERDVVLVYAGVGIGAAAVVNGQLVHGAGGLAGELGHVRVCANGQRCSCGKTGCLETVASADAVICAAAARWKRKAPRPAGELTIGDIAAAAAAGDQIAVEILGEAGRDLGTAAAWMVNLLDPACVVLSGCVGEAGPALAGPFEQAMTSDARPVRVVVSELGEAAELQGMLLMAREHASADIRIVTR